MTLPLSAPKKTVSRADLLKSWLTWTFFSHSNYNYERLQATAFAHSMVPIINKLYDTKEEKAAALKRHLVFFNTEPNVGHVIHGITIAMEEERANGAKITDDDINGVKTGLMGPLAGVGDTLTQGTMIPILLAMGISMAQQGNVMGPILYAVLAACLSWGIGYTMFSQGYRVGRQSVINLLQGGLLHRVTSIAGILGATVVGALAAQYVHLDTKATASVGLTVLHVQKDVLDKIMPGLLPLGLTLLCYFLLKKGVSSLKLVLGIVALGIFGTHHWIHLF